MGAPGLSRLSTAAFLLLVACAGAPRPAPPDGARAAAGSPSEAGARAAQTAQSLIGSPYRFGGATPRGFDCSGLVLYSFADAGIRGLPHSAEALERVARPVTLAELEPGDLLFFRLVKHKTSHVGIYVGDRHFVHAPSSGKRVERVSFDHAYWGPRIARAGRIGFRADAQSRSKASQSRPWRATR